ncbi:hypothetical protein [Brevundimonas sp.]|uniref:hypothetical protein n=1 Tax=Brevundimonas sp. TaxID=1871086 RepID=UPI001D4F566F|nr:hypothetical protein [Brevundimonas sp.]MBA3999164.1 hypothetical protein [Brevundimonas sp.]
MNRNPKADDFASVTAAELQTFEQILDQAIASGGQVLITLSAGRTSANLAAAIGQKGAERLAAALQGLLTVRGHVVDAHRYLERDARAMGMNWSLFAPLEDKDGSTVPDRPTRTATLT